MSCRATVIFQLRRRLAVALLCAMPGLGLAQNPAQNPAGVFRESAVKAAFLSKFGGFVEWPAGAFARPDEPITIGVLGNDAVAADLEQLVRGQPGGGAMVVRRLRDGDSLAGLHVLFVGAGRDERLREVAAALHAPVLVVSEQENGLRLGAMLNLFVQAGRVRFSASVQAAEARGLRLSARLLVVAQGIEGRGADAAPSPRPSRVDVVTPR